MDIEKVFQAAYNLGEYDAMYNDPSDKWTFEKWKQTKDYKELVKESDSLPCGSDQRELLIKYEAWRSTQNVLWDEDKDNVDEFLDQ